MFVSKNMVLKQWSKDGLAKSLEEQDGDLANRAPLSPSWVPKGWDGSAANPRQRPLKTVYWDRSGGTTGITFEKEVVNVQTALGASKPNGQKALWPGCT